MVSNKPAPFQTSTKVAKEASISFAGFSFGNLVRYLFTALLARWVGVEYLGLYSLANAVTRVMEVFGKAGLDNGILKYVSMRRSRGESELVKQDIGSAMKMGGVFSLLVMVFQILLSTWLVREVFHAPALLRTVLIVNAITVPLSVLTMIAAFSTQGYKILKYKVLVTQILNPLILLLAMIVTYLFLSREMTIILPTAISAALGFTVMMKYLKGMTGVGLLDSFPARFQRELLSFSLPLMFVTVIGTIMHWTDIMMLGYFTDSKTVGLYHPAARTAGLLQAILMSFGSIFSPLLSQLFTQGRQKEMKELFQLVSRWILTLTLPIVMIIFIFPQKVMLLFGPAYLPGATVLMILTGATFIQAFFGIGAPALTMTGHQKINLINTIVVAVINIGLNLILIPRYGITGAALATLSSLVLIALARFGESWVILNLHPFSVKLLKPAIAGIGTLVVLMLTRPLIYPLHTLLTLSAAAIITFFVYCLLLWVLKLDAADREVLQALRAAIISRRNGNYDR